MNYGLHKCSEERRKLCNYAFLGGRTKQTVEVASLKNTVLCIKDFDLIIHSMARIDNTDFDSILICI